MAPPETHIQTWGPQKRLHLREPTNDIIVSQVTTPWLSFQFNVTFAYKMHVKGHKEIFDNKYI
jgi:hypothetical protein